VPPLCLPRGPIGRVIKNVVSPTWLAHSTHADVVTYFPSEAGMPKNEDVCCIVADIFRFRLIFYFVAFDFVRVALRADVLFAVMRIIIYSYNFDLPVPRFFHDTNNDRAGLRAIRRQMIEEADASVFS